MERGRKRRKGESDAGTKPRKRFVWPEDVHHKFIAAVFDVGLRCASGPALMQMVSDPSKANAEEIEGHLQKFRSHRLPQEEVSMHLCLGRDQTHHWSGVGMRRQQVGQRSIEVVSTPGGGDWERGPQSALSAGELPRDPADSVLDDRRRESLAVRRTKILATSSTLRRQLDLVEQSLQTLMQFQSELVDMVTLQRHLQRELTQRLSSLQALAASISDAVGVHDAGGDGNSWFPLANGSGTAGLDPTTNDHLADGAFSHALTRNGRGGGRATDGWQNLSQTPQQPTSTDFHGCTASTPAVLGAQPQLQGCILPPQPLDARGRTSSASRASGAWSPSHNSSSTLSSSSGAHHAGWHAAASSAVAPPTHSRRSPAHADSAETSTAAGAGGGDSRSLMEMEMQSHMSMHRTMLTMHMEGQLAQYSMGNDKDGGSVPAETARGASQHAAAVADASRLLPPPSTQASEDRSQPAKAKAPSPGIVGTSEDLNLGDWGWMDAAVDENQLFEFLKE